MSDFLRRSAHYQRSFPAGTQRLTTGCQYCAVGCGYNAFLVPEEPTDGQPEVHEGVPAVITAAMRGHVRLRGTRYSAGVLPDVRCDLNKGNHSVRGGSQGHNLVSPETGHRSTADRLTSPMVRLESGELVEIDWPTAHRVMARLIADATGMRPAGDTIEVPHPEHLGVKVFEYQYLENTYAVTKLAYAALGTPNVAYHDRPSAAGSSPGLGDVGFRPHDFAYEDLDHTDVLLICGSNPYENQSVFFMQHCVGHEMIVLDPRRSATAQYAVDTGGLHLQPTRLGADPLVLYALAREILRRWLAQHPDLSLADFPRHPLLGDDPASLSVDSDYRKKQASQRRRASRARSLQQFARQMLAIDDPASPYSLARAAEISGIPLAHLQDAAARLHDSRARTLEAQPRVGILYEKGLIWGFNYHNTAAVGSLGLLLGAYADRGRFVGRCGGHQKGWAEAREPVEVFSSSGDEGYPFRHASDRYCDAPLRALTERRNLDSSDIQVHHNIDHHVLGYAEERRAADQTGVAPGRVRLDNGLVTVAAPDVRLLWIIGGNYLGQTNDAQRKRARLEARMRDQTGAIERPSDASEDSIVEALSRRMQRGGIVMVHQELFANPTTALCDLVLPAAGWGEQDSCRYNAQRRLKLFERFQDPPLHPVDAERIGDGDPYADMAALQHSPRPDWVTVRDIAHAIGALMDQRHGDAGDDRFLQALRDAFPWANDGEVGDAMARESHRGLFAERFGGGSMLGAVMRYAEAREVAAPRLHNVLGRNQGGDAPHLTGDLYQIRPRIPVSGNGVASNGVLLPARTEEVDGQTRLLGTLTQGPKGPLYFIEAGWHELEDAFHAINRHSGDDDEVWLTNGRFNHLWNNMFHHIRNDYINERYPEDMPGTVVELSPVWCDAREIVDGQVIELVSREGRFRAIASRQPSVPEGGAFALFSYPVASPDTPERSFAGYANNACAAYADGINPIGALKYGRAVVRPVANPVDGSRSWVYPRDFIDDDAHAGRRGPSHAPRNRITLSNGHTTQPERQERWDGRRRAEWRMREMVVTRGLPRAMVHGYSRRASLLDPDGFYAELQRTPQLRDVLASWTSWMNYRAGGQMIDAWDETQSEFVRRWRDQLASTGQSTGNGTDPGVDPGRPGTTPGGREYRIHPAIGVARVGDSEHYYLGPEIPGDVPNRGQLYRDGGDPARIKKQAQRFRIYEYQPDSAGVPRAVREITAADAQITWQIRLVNSKAALRQIIAPARPRNQGLDPVDLTIDSGTREVATGGSVALEGHFQGTDVRLGRALVGDDGRLVVLGGDGIAEGPQPVTDFANNDGWYDDTSDGVITATIRLPSGETVESTGSARILVGPPAYAPAIENLVTLYDVLFQVGLELSPKLWPAGRNPAFHRDIVPILRRAVRLRWVSDDANLGHGAGRPGDFLAPARLQLLGDRNTHPDSLAYRSRRGVFLRLRTPSDAPPPDRTAGDPDIPPWKRDMPALLGGGGLTPHQYDLMRQWSIGQFELDEPRSITALEQLPIAEQPAALDRAALEPATGTPFYPGIECCKLIMEPSFYTGPFRIATRVPPGTFTQGSALPWQADFHECGNGWWPSQRPNQVWRRNSHGQVTAGHEWVRSSDGMNAMVEGWRRLGFVVEEEDVFVETERQS